MRVRLLLIGLLLNNFAHAATDTLKLYFEIGVSELSANAKFQIDSLMYNDVLLPGKKLGIVGYADYLGSEQSNIHLSEARAKKVQDYLISGGIKAEDIQVVMGKGEISRSVLNGSAGYMEDRRVDILPGGIVELLKAKTSSIDLANIKKNGTIRLDNVYFKPGSHMPVETSYTELKKLFTILKETPTLKISIEGHICCVIHGTTDGYDIDADDFNLSVNRAKYIYEYLVKKGIAADRLAYKGFGKMRPLVTPEKTPEDENKNRRVEVRVIDK